MATWTEADITKLRAAIVAIASGEGVQQVSYAGPPARTITYHQTDLAQMRSLLASMIAEVGAEAGTRKSFSLISTKKGL